MQKFDVAIIGGGAAGLACAATIKKLSPALSVCIAESGARLGKKIAATGNGQGNISNADMSARHFHGSLKDTAYAICNDERYNPFSLFDFLTITDRAGRVYPSGRQASAVSDCLIRRVNSAGITVRTGAAAVSVSKGFVISLSDGGTVYSRRVCLAAGGKAQKQFGTDGSSFSLAKSVGHSITPIFPSLVQLKTDGGFKMLKGLRAECAVTVCGNKDFRFVGDVIFTDYGLSGNAIFSASAYCADKTLTKLKIEFLPDVPAECIKNIVQARLDSGYKVEECLGGTLHNALGRELIKRCPDKTAEGIALFVKSFPVDVVGTLGWDYAQVTKGGIPAEEVTENLESKIMKGLYFVGEALDVDGDCGGYNLHFAFASGMYVAEKIVASLSGEGQYD